MKEFAKLVAIPFFFVAGIILIGSENSYENYAFVQVVKAIAGIALMLLSVKFYKELEKYYNNKK